MPNQSVWLVYQMSSPMDRLKSIHSTEDKARIECDTLDKLHPRADGFYFEEWEIK